MGSAAASGVRSLRAPCSRGWRVRRWPACGRRIGGRARCLVVVENLGVAEQEQPRADAKNATIRKVREEKRVGHAWASRTVLSQWPVWLRGSAAIASGVPTATTWPPASPPSGPMSMTQSADLMTSRLCSMTRSEPPPSMQLAKGGEELGDVVEVKAGGGFVEDVEGAAAGLGGCLVGPCCGW